MDMKNHLMLVDKIDKMMVNHMTEMALALRCSCRLVELTRKKVERGDCKKVEVQLTRKKVERRDCKKVEVQLTRKKVERRDCKKIELKLELELHIYFLLPQGLEEIHTRHYHFLADKKVPRVCSHRKGLGGQWKLYMIAVSFSSACILGGVWASDDTEDGACTVV